MKDERPLQVGMLCYPRLTQLDVTGPYEVLSRMPNAEVYILWKDIGSVMTEGRFSIVPPALCASHRHWTCSLYPEALVSRT